MYEPGERMLDADERPTVDSVAKWIGPANHKRWTRLLAFVTKHYPNVFDMDDWLFGGKKHGWILRLKKSKSFCTLIPERNRFVVQIVFGAEERAKVEAILNELSPSVRKEYKEATTYHDGKWIVLVVDEDAILKDIETLLSLKRMSKRRRDS